MFVTLPVYKGQDKYSISRKSVFDFWWIDWINFVTTFILVKCFDQILSFYFYLDGNVWINFSSVVDPELFILGPDPALHFPSSGSESRQKFRIHADPDPTYIN